MWVSLDVRQEDAELLKLGVEVDFQSEVDSRVVPGRLTWIGTDVDPRTRTVRARAEVENPVIDAADTSPASRRLLQAGMFGSAKIFMSRRPTAVMIPNEALHWQWEIGRELVFIPSSDGKTFTPRMVEKGLVRDGFVEIRDGLHVGEPIAISGCRVLSSELSQLLQQRSGDNAHGVRSFR
jgi:cobalt-zinc-cadmium efflux system membrane fusion protein